MERFGIAVLQLLFNVMLIIQRSWVLFRVPPAEYLIKIPLAMGTSELRRHFWVWRGEISSWERIKRDWIQFSDWAQYLYRILGELCRWAFNAKSCNVETIQITDVASYKPKVGYVKFWRVEERLGKVEFQVRVVTNYAKL